jgi:hypothetical protein
MSVRGYGLDSVGSGMVHVRLPLRQKIPFGLAERLESTYNEVVVA